MKTKTQCSLRLSLIDRTPQATAQAPNLGTTMLSLTCPLSPHLKLWGFASYQDIPFQPGKISQSPGPHPSCQDGGHRVIPLSPPPTHPVKVSATHAGPPHSQIQMSLSCQHPGYTLNVFKVSSPLTIGSLQQ